MQIFTNRALSAPFTIGVISRLTEWKGVKYIAEAFQKFQQTNNPTKLIIVGEWADSYQEIRNSISPHCANFVEFRRSETNIPRFLSEIDVFVHVPIGPDEEAFGLVYVEALATGLPCIFTKSGIMLELPNSERYVFAVPYRDSNSIYHNLKVIKECYKDNQKLVPRDWLKQFEMDKMVNRYFNLIIDSGR